MHPRSHPAISLVRLALPALFLLGGVAPAMPSALARPAGDGALALAPITPAPTKPPEPLAIIIPKATSYSYTSQPVFDINAGSNRWFVVELALSRHLFNADASSQDARCLPRGVDSRVSVIGDAKFNFYTTAPIATDANGRAIFNLGVHASTVWWNLRGSRVFYRVITALDQNGTDIKYSTADTDCENAPALDRTGEAWYGQPLNDQATTRLQGVRAVINGLLNPLSISYGYGPRVVNGSRFHGGFDIPVANGHPVYAIADGAVQTSFSPSDHYVVLSHGDIDHDGSADRTGYAHLDSSLVAVGEQVEEGQLLGYSGDYVGGQHRDQHLHFDAGIGLFHNPLHYLPYSESHTVRNDDTTFLHDAYTNNRVIDVVPAMGNRGKALVVFHVTTATDKDLNYASVQVDGSSEVGQAYELDYDRVTDQDSGTGIVTVGAAPNESYVLVTPDDVYQYIPGQLQEPVSQQYYGLLVKPNGATGVGLPFSHYVFFPWDTSSLDELDSPYTIDVTVGEVDGTSATHTVTVGPKIELSGEATINGREISFPLRVNLYDIPEIAQGMVELDVVNLPTGWQHRYSEANPVTVDLANGVGSKNVTLTLTSPTEPIDTSLLNDTWARARLQRLPKLKHSVPVCDQGGGNGGMAAAAALAAGGCGGLTPKAVVTVDKATAQPGDMVNVEVQATLLATSGTLIVNQGNTNTEYALSKTTNELAFHFSWTVPSQPAPPVDYTLLARVSGMDDSDPVTVHVYQDPPQATVTFKFPDEDPKRLPMRQTVTIVVDAPDEADQVVLNVVPGDNDSGGDMTKNQGTGDWERSWAPSYGSDRLYFLVARAYRDGLEMASANIRVISVGESPAPPLLVVPSVAYAGMTVEVKIDAPSATEATLTVDGVSVTLQRNGSVWSFQWSPGTGTYHLHAHVTYNGFPPVDLDATLQVLDPLQWEVNQINPDVVVGKLRNYQPQAALYFHSFVPTPFATNRYACGVIGFRSWGGDIGEQVNPDLEVPDIVGVYLAGTGGSWQLMADFNTLHRDWFFWPVLYGDYVDRPEYWDVDVLCVSRQVASIQAFSGLGDNVYRDTGIRFDQQACAVAGFDSGAGDINEHDSGDIIQVYLYREGTTWRIRADFRTHEGRHEDWTVNLLCVPAKSASLNGAQTGKPFFLKPLPRFNNPAHGSTGVRHDQFACGIAGLAAVGGDIEEGDRRGTEVSLLSAQLTPNQDNTWHFTGDFRSHDDHEDWDVSVLCVARDLDGVDQPPAISPLGMQYAWSGGTMGFTVTAQDDGLARVLLAASGLPEGAQFSVDNGWNLVNGQFIWTPKLPTGVPLQEFGVTFTAKTGGQSTSQNVVIRVCDTFQVPDCASGVVHHVPTIGPIPDQTVVVNQPLTFRVRAFDKDGDRVYLSMRCKTTAGWFSCASLGMYLQPVEGEQEVNATFRWTPRAPATVRVQFHANDRVDGIGSRDVIITVPGPQADLAVTDLSWSPAAPKAGDSVAFEVTVQNQGGAGIEATSIACRLTSPTGTLIGESALITFMPGETRSIPCGSYTFSLAFTYIVYGVVESDGGDANPTNDLRFESLIVSFSQAFYDVPTGHWAFDYMEYLYENGYTGGTQTEPVRLFSPERILNRVEMAVFLVRLLHPDVQGYVASPPPYVIWDDARLQYAAIYEDARPCEKCTGDGF